MRTSLILLTCAMGLSISLGSAAQTPAEPFDHDGWYSWRVETVPNAPEWCCYTRKAGVSNKSLCQLDQGNGSFGNTSETNGGSDEVQIYALVEEGEIIRLKTLSTNCDVESEKPWSDLGLIDTSQSLNWLTQSGSSASDLMPAIAMHNGQQSLAEMEQFAVSGTSLRQRRDAIFWLGQLRISEAGGILVTLINDDDNSQIREHAIFSYAQSPAPDRLDVLVEIVGDNNQRMSDRQSALFWLAQLEDGSGVDFIHDLLLTH